MTPLCALREAWLDGEIAPEERSRFDDHLATCSECQAAVDAWRRTTDQLQHWGEAWHGPVPSGEVQRLLAKARAPLKARHTSSMRWAMRGVALATIAVAAVVYWQSETQYAVELESGVVVASAVLEAPADDAPLVAKIGDDRIRLKPGSALGVVNASSRRTTLNLIRGSVAAEVDPKRGGRRFIVEAGEVRVAVVGTVFQVTRLRDGALISVSKGRVKVTRDDIHFDVDAHKQLRLDATGTHWDAAAESLDEEAPSVTPDAGELDFDEDDVKDEVELDAGTQLEDRPPSPTYAPAPLQTWRALAARGKCAQIIRDLSAYAKKERRDAAAWRLLGDCLGKLDRNRDAAAAYRHLAKIAPRDESTEALLLEASILQDRLGDHRAALPILREYVKRHPPPNLEAAALVRQAKAFILLGDQINASKALNRVIQKFSESPAAAEALRLQAESPQPMSR